MHRIILAPNTTHMSDVAELIRVAKAVGVRVSVLPRMFEAVGAAVEFDDVDGLTMLGVRRFGLVRSSHFLKRAFDILAGSIVLLLVAPLMAAIAVAIRLDSKGPVFFRQPRVGRDGRHFRIFKYRSMVADADDHKDRLRELNEAGVGLFKITHDPRVTRVGAFLRRTSLDELPQLFNVMRGEMSLVGPRPLVIDEDAMVVGLDRSRLHLTPGHDRPVAGPRNARADAGDGRDRLPLRVELVALAGPQAAAAHGASRAASRQRLTSSKIFAGSRGPAGATRSGCACSRPSRRPSEAQIGQIALAGQRLIVRRVRALDAEGELLHTWEQFPFPTNRTDALELVEAEHRRARRGRRRVVSRAGHDAFGGAAGARGAPGGDLDAGHDASA